MLERLTQYALLLRLNKPIGILLLLWPTLTALWLASGGVPDLKYLIIFGGGVFLLRAAGCILNDLADRKFDGLVQRTQQRPLATNKVSIKEALLLSGLILLIALGLVLLTNLYTIVLAVIGLLLTMLYPFAKRYTHFPQVVLGITFNLGILMAFTAVTNHIPAESWLLYSIAVIWTVAYDTQYGMVDRADDLRIGIKSTAILFGEADRMVIAGLQFVILILLLTLGQIAQLNYFYYVSLLATAGFFFYQQYLICDREPALCFKAFLNNNWAWLMVFLGVVFGVTNLN